jgi:hypothetical protein
MKEVIKATNLRALHLALAPFAADCEMLPLSPALLCVRGRRNKI